VTIQHHYLETAEANLHAGFMPSWAAGVCTGWRAMLDRLEGAPDSVAGCLDWALKYQILRNRARHRGLEWKPEHLVRLREELLEVDMRFGEIGPRSIFSALDRAGVLQHRVPGVEPVAAAVDTPPEIGRARVRGDLVARGASEPDRYVCDWAAVRDVVKGKWVDLSDPFARQARWQSFPPAAGDESIASRLPAFLENLLR
jgi:hypothetical protein